MNYLTFWSSLSKIIEYEIAMNKTTLLGTIFIGIAAIMMTLTFTPSATADTFYCSGGQTFSAFNNIIVPEGQTCVLGQFNVVQGDIEVKQGASLYVYADNDIAGSVIADGAETVYIADVGAPAYDLTMGKPAGVNARGIITFINNPDTHGKITRTEDGSNDQYQFRIPQDIASPNYDPKVGDSVSFNVSPSPAKKAFNVISKALGLVILGNVDVRNTDNFSLIGNTYGISIVRGDVSVQNTQTVEIIDVAGVANTGFGIGGDLKISTSVDCVVSGNVVSGSTELSGCSNLTS